MAPYKYGLYSYGIDIQRADARARMRMRIRPCVRLECQEGLGHPDIAMALYTYGLSLCAAGMSRRIGTSGYSYGPI